MKITLLLLIRCYWAIIPKANRRKCIFRKSCSQYVYQTTKDRGGFKGFKALIYRYRNCRAGFGFFEHPIDKSTMMILPNGEILKEEQIAERFIKQF